MVQQKTLGDICAEVMVFERIRSTIAPNPISIMQAENRVFYNNTFS